MSPKNVAAFTLRAAQTYGFEGMLGEELAKPFMATSADTSAATGDPQVPSTSWNEPRTK